MNSPSTPRAAASFEAISLEPNPVIEAYKADVDMTLVHENRNPSRHVADPDGHRRAGVS